VTIADLRKEYTQGGLTESEADLDPFKQFQIWFEQALNSQLYEPNAMSLATCTPDGLPSVRIVLLKGFSERGFQFFTNYESRKGRELSDNPHAALVLYWPELERQVRIEGVVEKVTPEESDAYHASRPRGSQMGAWTSSQSVVISGREVLEKKLQEYEQQFGDGIIPRPPHWGGYRLVPSIIEFWQGRPNRLHDRLQYRRTQTGWVRKRLSP
jgi:pyridoxamine 5'-phosphate oxidase